MASWLEQEMKVSSACGHNMAAHAGVCPPNEVSWGNHLNSIDLVDKKIETYVVLRCLITKNTAFPLHETFDA